MITRSSHLVVFSFFFFFTITCDCSFFVIIRGPAAPRPERPPEIHNNLVPMNVTVSHHNNCTFVVKVVLCYLQGLNQLHYLPRHIPCCSGAWMLLPNTSQRPGGNACDCHSEIWYASSTSSLSCHGMQSLIFGMKFKTLCMKYGYDGMKCVVVV